MKKWIGLLLIIVLTISCNQQTSKTKFVDNPSTLEELYRGFNEAELTPDVFDLKKESIIIVATGHLYPLLKYPEVYNAFVDKIIEQDPDYFFSLGDIVYNNSDEEWVTVKSYLNRLNTTVYFSPGNHDLNYHYERYFGKRDNQIEAEMRYLEQVGYRYKVLQDQFANYVIINANDSAQRILSYIDIIKPTLDYNKHLILLSSQSLWFKTHQDPNDPKTWVKKPFPREDFLPFVEDFEYLIHGDWGGNFYRGRYKKSLGTFDVMAVGNRKVGDSLFITRLEIFNDTILARPIRVHIPETSTWYKDIKVKKK